MSEERAPYNTSPLRVYPIDDQAQPSPVAHQHQYRFLAAGKRVIRFCEQCGRSWMIAEIHDLVSSRTVPCWTEVLEEDAARDKLWELNQPNLPQGETPR